MTGAVQIDPDAFDVTPSARGLRGLWGWVRRAILRRPTSRASPFRAASRTPTKPAAAADDDETFQPHGAVIRTAPPAPAPAPRADSAGVNRTLSEVPPLPHVVRELLHELADPASSARSVARIAASDPALAATLIRTVNSAAIGLRQKVTGVTQAVSFLGYATVRSLVIRMRLRQAMPTRAGQPAYDAEDLWVHSLAVSCAAEALAERVPGVDKDFVSTLGLLHDIGKLAINSYFPASADAIRTRSADHAGESFLDRERRVLGADHAEVGAMLAVHWKLPADLVEAIRWHHAPQDAPAALPGPLRTAAMIVHVANQLAKYCYVYSEDMEIDIVPDDLLRAAGLPGPLPRLLGNRVRRAISRAIFFADDNSSSQSLGAIRRFLRLADKPKLPTLPPPEPSPTRHEPRVGWADDGWAERLLPNPTTIDCGPSSSTRLDRAAQSAGRRARLRSRCTAGGVDRLLGAALIHQDALPLVEDDKLAARFVLRRLLPNLSEIAAAEHVEVLQGVEAGMLITAVCSPALRFDARFGEGADRRAARQVLYAELANVLNLRWFTRILTPREGGALIFINPAAA